jgi:two-component system response regulator HydG
VAAALAKRLQDATRRRDRFFAPECPAGVPLVGQSAGLRRTLETINLVAENNLCPVLITGETGAGKELAAQAVHVRTTGGWSNFVAVNCATLTEHLLESDLFGHVRGAFTGADRERTGLFEAAGTGTIFLDEISEMPPNLQARLLRAIQERKFRKVGGTKDIACRATIVASSNRDLLAESRAGRFRRDLYYRLAVLPIALPPLRAADRRDDIPLLADYFIETLGQGRSRVIGLAADAREALLAHDWPGNVRELRNVIERSLLIEKGTRLTRESLLLDGYAPFPASAACHSQTLATDTGPQAAAEDDFSLETAERMFITRALQETGGQRTRAAALLGITRATLHAKLKRYQIDVPGGDGSCEPSHSLAESPADMAC